MKDFNKDKKKNKALVLGTSLIEAWVRIPPLPFLFFGLKSETSKDQELTFYCYSFFNFVKISRLNTSASFCLYIYTISLSVIVYLYHRTKSRITLPILLNTNKIYSKTDENLSILVDLVRCISVTK